MKRLALLALALFCLASAPVRAADPFYKGKTIRIVISTGVAGGYMEYARALARHLTPHLAGNPGFVVESMPGAGGLLAANYLYANAPRDGLTMAMVHSTIPLAPLWGGGGARFDALKFNWLGALDRADGVCTVWHTSPVKTWADMQSRELTVGSMGVGSPTEVYPAVLNRYFGTEIKVIGGYHSGTEVDLAVERGELEGRCGTHLNTYKAMRANWISQGLVRVPVVFAEQRLPDYPDAPSVLELTGDETIRQQIELIMTTQYLDRPMLMPPGVPHERVAEMNAALAEVAADPALHADLARSNFTFNYADAADMATRLRRAYSYPAETVNAVRAWMGAPQDPPAMKTP